MKQETIDILVISNSTLFEKDKRIEGFSPHRGRCTFLAKSACNIKSKFGGRLEVFNHISIRTYKGASFELITECTLIKAFTSLRSSFNHISMASYFVDIIKKSTNTNQHNHELFHLLHNHIHMLDTHANNSEALASELSLQDIQQHFHTHYLICEGLYSKDNTSPSLGEFKHAFQQYTHTQLKEPLLIHP